MKLDVFLTAEAYETLELTLQSVREKWGERSAAKLEADIWRKLRLISAQPYIYKASALNPQLRKGTLSKQTSFFYEVNADYIMVHYFWDNRQAPII